MSLGKCTQIDNKKGSPHSHMLKQLPHIIQEASLCTGQRASYTVEAAVVLPLMAGFFVCILFFFRILQVQCAVEEALIYAGRKTAVESSVVTSSELLLASAKGYLVYALEDSDVVEKYVRGGSLGVLLSGSNCQGEEIDLIGSYEVSLPVGFWNIGRIKLYSQNCFQKWNGDVDNTREQWVYLTPNGNVYHISKSCRVLDLSIREVSISRIKEERGKDGQKYKICPRCCISVGNCRKVYCTDYGILYHMDISCSYLKRTINKVRLEEVEGRSPCSYCN